MQRGDGATIKYLMLGTVVANVTIRHNAKETYHLLRV